MIHMINMIFFTLFFGIFVISTVVDKYSDDEDFIKLTSFMICTSIFLAVDILVLEFVVLLILIPAITICAIVYL